MFDNEPQTLSYLQSKLAHYCVAANDNLQPFKRIMMVGAFNNAASVPTGYDKLYLEMTALELHKRKLPIANDFSIDIVNIHKNEGGRDFLKETAPADLLILCFVFNPASQSEVPLAEFQGIKTSSPDYFKPHAWHDAALRVGAKCISVLGDSDSELGPGVFTTRGKDSQYINLGQSYYGGPHILIRPSAFKLV